MKGPGLVIIAVVLFLISVFNLLTLGDEIDCSETRVGKSDLTIQTVEVDPDIIGQGILNYPDSYSSSKYKSEEITMEVSDEVPEEGDPVQINLTVFNLGLKSGSADVEFYDGSKDSGVFIGSDHVNVSGLGYDIARTTWHTEGIVGEDHDIFAYVIPEDPKNESETDNNQGSKDILINFYPLAKISGYIIDGSSNGKIIEGDVVTFDGSGSSDTPRDLNAGLDYHWSFNDRNHNESNPNIVEGLNQTLAEHNFQDSGMYRIDLEISDQHGASRNDTIFINVSNRIPEPVIKVERDIIFEDEMVVFDSSETGDSDHDLRFMKYRWDPGDGNGTNWIEETTFEYTYQRSGEYKIELEAMDDEGEIGQVRTIIEVKNVGPTAVIDKVDVNGVRMEVAEGKIEVLEDDLIHLFGSSSFDTVSDRESLVHYWISNGITISEDEDVWLRYHEMGEKKISLVVTDDDGDSSRESLDIIVGNAAPVADAGEDGVFYTSRVEFNASLSYDTPSDRRNLSYRWDFGDGRNGEGITFKHEYEKKGIYTVKLEVEDDDGEVSEDTIEIEIRNIAPQIKAEVPWIVDEDEFFTLDARESVDPDGEIVDHIWSFSDGSEKSGIVVNHTFHSSGNENVVLSVVDDDDALVRMDFTVMVENLEPVAEAGNDNETALGKELILDGSGSWDTPSDKRNLTYSWKLENGTVLHGKNPALTLFEEGIYRIELKVTDPEGLFSWDSIRIRVWGSIIESIEIEVRVEPEKCSPNEEFRIQGRVLYKFFEGIPDENFNLALVAVNLDETIHNVRTNENGKFSLVLQAPPEEGSYSVECSLTRLGISGKETSVLKVERNDRGNEFIDTAASPVAIATGVSIAVIGGGSVVVLSTDLGRWKFFLLLIPLYSRLKRDRVLDNFERGRIYQYILMNPGDYYSSIKKSLGLNNGTLTYHLKVLEQKEFIKSRTSGRVKRFYPFGMKISQGPHRDIQDLILVLLYIHPGMSQKEISDELGIHVSTVNYHINMMVGAGILGSRKKDRIQRYEPAVFYHETPADG